MPHNSKRNNMRRRIAPGIWEDMAGDIHWSIPELLAHVDLEDTPENREIVSKMLREMVLKASPDAKIVLREKPD